MIKYIKKYKFYIILFLFILIPLISIDTATRSPRQYRIYDHVILTITYPVQSIMSWALEAGYHFVQNYLVLWNTKKNNILLYQENQRLINTIINLQETEKENQRLRQLLDFKEKHELKTIVGRVIAKDVSKEFRAIRINRGTDNGIEKDMPVVNEQGVIGRVFRTTNSTSDIVIILDLLSAIDAIDLRSRVRGIVQGMSEDLCELKFALRTDDIQNGDLLVSSGLGGIFPKGIPVGTVSKVDKKSYGVSQYIEVIPSVDFSKLEEVLVITDFNQVPIHVGQENIIEKANLLPSPKNPPQPPTPTKPLEIKVEKKKESPTT